MALPDSPDLAFAPNSLVPSAFLNHLQAVIVTMNAAFAPLVAGKRNNTRPITLGAGDFVPVDGNANWELTDQGESGSSGATSWKRTKASGTVGQLVASIPLDAGDRLVSYVVYLLDPDVSDPTHRTKSTWQRITMVNGLSQEAVDAPATVPSVAGPGMTTITDNDCQGNAGRAPGARVAGERYQLIITTDFIGAQIFGVELVIDHP